MVKKDKNGKLTKQQEAQIRKDTKQEERLKKRSLKQQSRREKDYQTSEERDFKALLVENGLQIKYMDGDGNCLFRSIADQLSGRPNDHYIYRQKVMAYIEEEKDHFSLFMEDDEPFDDYIARMKYVLMCC
jgi:OTU domain-containing protein 3